MFNPKAILFCKFSYTNGRALRISQLYSKVFYQVKVVLSDFSGMTFRPNMQTYKYVEAERESVQTPNLNVPMSSLPW